MMKNDSTLLLLHANARGGLRRKKNKMFKNFGNRYFQVHIRNQLQKISNSSPNTTIFG